VSGRNGVSKMDQARGNTDRQLQFLQDLLAENAWISGDVLQIYTGTWAVHGVIAVDGDVLMAAFDSDDDARRTLDQLRSGSQPIQ
jgi:hypothetical protein